MGIYRYERRLWPIVEGPEGIKKSETIIPPNKKLLLNYAEYLKDTGKSLPRLDKLVRTLKIFAVFLGLIPFKLATKENMVQILAKGGSTRLGRAENTGRIG